MTPWLHSQSPADHHVLDGSLVFADISGFTQMCERLARLGRVGSEEVTELLNRDFTALLELAFAEGGDLLKFGGDALLLLFAGDHHPHRAIRAAARMRDAMRGFGAQDTAAGGVRLRMSCGVHSGPIDFFVVGSRHRELVVSGPAATVVREMEAAAGPGQIVLSDACAGRVEPYLLGRQLGAGRLLREAPPAASWQATWPDGNADLAPLAIPTALRRHLGSGRLDGDHRGVAIGFIRFEGVDELLRSGRERDAAERLDHLLSGSQEIADRFDICLLQTDIDADGGKIILTAGAPDRHEFDAERLLGGLHEIGRLDSGLDLRLGANAGQVFAAEVGHPERRVYTIIGDAVNLAARVMAHAAPGQLLATPAVLEAGGSTFRVTPLAPFRAKGKREPVEIASVDGIGPGTSGPSEMPEHAMPIVGRERELEELLSAAEEAASGRGATAELVGGAGMGKSRLVAEIAARGSFDRILQTRCIPYQASTPYFAFRSLLREAVGIPRYEGRVDAGVMLERWIEEHAPSLLPWGSLIAAASDAELSESEDVRSLQPEFRRAALHRAVRELLEVALPGHTLLVFNDTQWADEASADLIAHLATRPEGRRWLLCLTRRPEGAHAWPEGAAVRTVELAPLAPGALTRLLAVASEDAPLPPHLARRVAERSGGNPLYLLELLRAVRTEVAADELPASIESVLAARVDRLALADRRWLRRAAVLGLQTDHRVLEEFLEAIGEQPQVPDPLAELLEQTSDVVRFRNALLHEVAYEGLPFRERRELHQHAAEVIERGAAGSEEDAAEALSLHFFRGHAWEPAWQYSVVAGDRARQKFANADAAEFYRRAVQAARRVASVDEAALAAIQESLGDVLQLAGEVEAADRAFGAAQRVRAVAEPATVVRMLRKRGELRERAGRYVDALHWYARGLRVVEASTAALAAAERAELSLAYAGVRYRQGRLRQCLRWGQRAIEEAAAAGNERALGHACYVVDNALRDTGQAPRFRERSLAIFERTGELVLMAKVLNNVAVDDHLAGRWSRALEGYRRAGDAADRAGDVMMSAMVRNNVGEILCDQAKCDEAEVALREALQTWRSIDFRAGVALATSNLGRVLSRTGRHEEARRLLLEAERSFDEIRARHLALDARARQAEDLMAAGDPGALEFIRVVLHEVKGVEGLDAVHAMLERLEAQALLECAAFDEARTSGERALDRARSAQAEYEVAQAHEILGRIAAAAGDEGAEAHFEAGRAGRRALGVVEATAVAAAR